MEDKAKVKNLEIIEKMSLLNNNWNGTGGRKILEILFHFLKVLLKK